MSAATGRRHRRRPAAVAVVADFDTVRSRPWKRNRDDAIGSAGELQEDWQRVRQGHLPKPAAPGWPNAP